MSKAKCLSALPRRGGATLRGYSALQVMSTQQQNLVIEGESGSRNTPLPTTSTSSTYCPPLFAMPSGEPQVVDHTWHALDSIVFADRTHNHQDQIQESTSRGGVVEVKAQPQSDASKAQPGINSTTLHNEETQDEEKNMIAWMESGNALRTGRESGDQLAINDHSVSTLTLAERFPQLSFGHLKYYSLTAASRPAWHGLGSLYNAWTSMMNKKALNLQDVPYAQGNRPATNFDDAITALASIKFGSTKSTQRMLGYHSEQSPGTKEVLKTTDQATFMVGQQGFRIDRFSNDNLTLEQKRFSNAIVVDNENSAAWNAIQERAPSRHRKQSQATRRHRALRSNSQYRINSVVLQDDATTEVSGDGSSCKQSHSLVAHDSYQIKSSRLLRGKTSTATGIKNIFAPTQPRFAAMSATSRRSMVMDENDGPSHGMGEDAHAPLSFQIPDDIRQDSAATLRSENAAFWSFEKYRGPNGDSVSLHYCKNKQQSETVAQLFIGEPVLGFDLEWKPQAKKDDIKQNVSLLQLASEKRIALFQFSLHKGDEPEDILAPALKAILESMEVLKCGVNILGDATRLRNHLGVNASRLFELSHLHKVVEYGNCQPEQVNKKAVSLASQVERHLGLPLYKGDERMSDWSKELSYDQCKYAGDDAYAGFCLFHALKTKWLRMDPRQPFPAPADDRLPIRLAKPAMDTASQYPSEEVESSSEMDSELSDDPNVAESLLNELDDLSIVGDGSDGAALEETLVSRQASSRGTSYPQIPALEFNDFPLLDARPLFIEKLKTDLKARGEDTALTSDQTSVLEANQRDLDLLNQAKVWAQEQISMAAADAQGPSKTRVRVTPAVLKAYYLWEKQHLEISEVAQVMRRDPPLKEATVVAYLAEALQYGGYECRDEARIEAVVKGLPAFAKDRYWQLVRDTGAKR